MANLRFPGLRTQPSVISLSDYLRAIAQNDWLSETAQGWEDFDEDYQHTSDAAIALIGAGLTAWHLPRFYADVNTLLFDLVLFERYQIAAFIADFLLDTLPGDPLDPDIAALLHQVRHYDYPEEWLRQGATYRCCKWPATPEFYRARLQWAIVELAEDAQADRDATTKAAIALYRQGRGREAFEMQQGK